MSSYIAFDLDALNLAPAVARASGMTEDSITAGLVRLWAWAFRSKTDMASDLVVRGQFGGDCTAALAAFGFLEKKSASEYRIRGAERYLRVTEGRSKGGKMSSGNLKRGTLQAGEMPGVQPGLQPGTSPGSSPAPAGNQPRLPPGLSPTTEHRRPNTDDRTPNTTGHALQAVWNDHKAATMPRWTATSAKRRRHADARLTEHSIEVLTEAVQRLAASDFASGRGGKWAATPDWLIESPGNVIKALEGNYDNRTGPTLRTAVAQPSDWATTKSVTVEDTF